MGASHLDHFIEIGVLPSRVLILAEDIVQSLSGLQVAHLIFFKVQRGVIFTGEGLDVGLPEGVGVGALTQQVEGQGDVAHGLEDPVLRIQRPWGTQKQRG